MLRILSKQMNGISYLKTSYNYTLIEMMALGTYTLNIYVS
jgi:hypothetical protein